MTDAGTNLKDAANSMRIIIKSVQTIASNRVWKVERSHAILRSIYHKLKMNMPSMSREELLLMSFRSINDAPISSSRKSPAMLVLIDYRKFLVHVFVVRWPNARIMHKARSKIGPRLYSWAACKIADRTGWVRQLAPGTLVLVYREKQGLKSYPPVRIQGNNVDD